MDESDPCHHLEINFRFARSQPLSPETRQRMEMPFEPVDSLAAEAMLTNECGNNLPLLGKCDAFQLERVRFAALKMSDGNLELLRRAVDLGKTDWRDLLMSAGFGDLEAHKKWLPEHRRR